MDKYAFELKNITFSYPVSEPVLRGLTLRIRSGESLCILGANGCGKSTLLRILGGLLIPQEGSFYFHGSMIDWRSITKKDAAAYHLRVGYVFQDSDVQLFCGSVLEEIAFGPLQTGLPREEIMDRVTSLARSLDIEKLLDKAPYHLSGGEKKKVAIASTLILDPDVLILDEPTNDLDIDTLTVLEDYLDSWPGAVVIVSHDRYFLDRLVVRTFAFEEGGYIGHYTGGYSKYMNEKEAREQERAEGDPGEVSSPGSADPEKNAGRHRRRKLKFSYNEKREYETIDDEIASLEEAIGDVEKDMEENGTNSARLTKLTARKAELEEQLDWKMERWEYLNELAERIERGEEV